jgi:glycerol kinase
VLVVDVGTSSVRAAVVRADGSFVCSHDRELLPDSPADGLVQFDAALMGETCLDLARAALDAAGPVDAVGISDQRGSTVVWDRKTGVPSVPASGGRTCARSARASRCAATACASGPTSRQPKSSGSSISSTTGREPPTFASGPSTPGSRGCLSDGAVHVTDATNAAITGMQTGDASAWDTSVLDTLGFPSR